MPITLTVEDGSGLADANSYVSLAEAAAFHETNVHSTDWPANEEDQKKALITATRIIDQHWQWNGYKKSATQALQWPRARVPDPDAAGSVVPPVYGFPSYLPDSTIPRALKNAVSDFARILFVTNPETRPDSEGISDFSLDGVMSVGFNYETRPDIIPEWLQVELSKYGTMVSSKSGTVKLVRA